MENVTERLSKNEMEIQAKLDQKAKIKSMVNTVLPFAGLIFIFFFFVVITHGKIINPSNIENLINQCVSLTIICVGAAFVYAHGGMDFSLGAAAGVAQLVGATLITKTELPLWVSFLAVVLTAVVCSSIVGGATNLFKVPVFITSLCMRTICMGILATVVANAEIVLPYNQFEYINNATVKAVVLIIVIMIGIYLFEYTSIGKYEKSIGGNIFTSSQAGIKTNSTKFLAYVFLGVCVGIAAVFMMLRSSSITSQSGSGMEFNVMIAIVLGGFPMTGGDASKMVSVIIGAITITLLTNGLIIWGLDVNVVNGIKGILFLIIVGLSYDRSKGKLIS
jgi:ribose transport system permease protein